MSSSGDSSNFGSNILCKESVNASDDPCVFTQAGVLMCWWISFMWGLSKLLNIAINIYGGEKAVSEQYMEWLVLLILECPTNLCFYNDFMD